MEWTMKQLVAQAALALSSLALDQGSGRISDVPTVRTVRYYATHGLVDKPIAFRGRTALYGQKHLLQIVAIKRLQSLGMTLDDIQARMAGLTSEQLEGLARISFGEEPGEVSDAPDEEAFWMHVPAQTDVDDATPNYAPSQAPPSPWLVQGVALTTDALLVLQSSSRPLDAEDMDSIRAAAQPLLALLKQRRLID